MILLEEHEIHNVYNIRSLVDLLRKSRTIETKFLIPFSINDPVRILVLKFPHSCEVDDLVCVKFVECLRRSQIVPGFVLTFYGYMY